MTFHPRGLLITASLLVLLWLAIDLRWAIALVAANVVFDLLAFGVVGTSRR